MPNTTTDPRTGRIIWTRLFIDSFLGRTRALSIAAQGAYDRLHLHYIASKRPLLDDDRELARLARCTVGEWRRARPQIVPDLLRPCDGHLIDDLAEERIAQFEQDSRRNRKAATARWQVIAGGKLEEGEL